MGIKFDSQQLIIDFDSVARRRKISTFRAAKRSDLDPSLLGRLRTGEVTQITVTTLAKMLHFMDNTDIKKYIYNEE